MPVFVLDEETEGLRAPGGASRWWLHHSLTALDRSLQPLGSRLILRRGRAETVLPELAASCDAEAIYWSRAYEPAATNSYLCLITGSSRTADIEKILVMGAHGPKRLIIILSRD